MEEMGRRFESTVGFFVTKKKKEKKRSQVNTGVPLDVWRGHAGDLPRQDSVWQGKLVEMEGEVCRPLEDGVQGNMGLAQQRRLVGVDVPDSEDEIAVPKDDKGDVCRVQCQGILPAWPGVEASRRKGHVLVPGKADDHLQAGFL